jgi:hypothetical protein
MAFSGTLIAGTVPRARLSGVGTGVDYNADAAATAGTLPIRNGYGGVALGYSTFNNGNNENPGISQVMVTNGSDDYMRKASITHLANSMPIVPSATNSTCGRRRIPAPTTSPTPGTARTGTSPATTEAQFALAARTRQATASHLSRTRAPATSPSRTDSRSCGEP